MAGWLAAPCSPIQNPAPNPSARIIYPALVQRIRAQLSEGWDPGSIPGGWTKLDTVIVAGKSGLTAE